MLSAIWLADSGSSVLLSLIGMSRLDVSTYAIVLGFECPPVFTLTKDVTLIVKNTGIGLNSMILSGFMHLGMLKTYGKVK